MKMEHWILDHPDVTLVIHAGLEIHPQHDLFKKQFTGSGRLFGLQVREVFSQRAVDYILKGMDLFSFDVSWGGYESVIIQPKINSVCIIEKWKYDEIYGQRFRIHVGLEIVEDLLKDFEEGFKILHRVNDAKKYHK